MILKSYRADSKQMFRIDPTLKQYVFMRVATVILISNA